MHLTLTFEVQFSVIYLYALAENAKLDMTCCRIPEVIPSSILGIVCKFVYIIILYFNYDSCCKVIE